MKKRFFLAGSRHCVGVELSGIRLCRGMKRQAWFYKFMVGPTYTSLRMLREKIKSGKFYRTLLELGNSTAHPMTSGDQRGGVIFGRNHSVADGYLRKVLETSVTGSR
jgi:hypothetical protein